MVSTRKRRVAGIGRAGHRRYASSHSSRHTTDGKLDRLGHASSHCHARFAFLFSRSSIMSPSNPGTGWPIGRRIHVIGNTASGKNILGVRLGQAPAVPFVELDALDWQPGWVELNATNPVGSGRVIPYQSRIDQRSSPPHTRTARVGWKDAGCWLDWRHFSTMTTSPRHPRSPHPQVALVKSTLG